MQAISNFSKFFKTYKILFFVLIALIIFLLSKDNGMFWDNVLFTSKIGNHFYNTSIFNWVLPDNLDSGHPPTLGFILAVFWNIFGYEKWVSHLFMIPCTIGFFYQLYNFIYYFTKSNSQAIFAFLLIIVDPTLSTQFVIVNPEIIQFFLFFLAINSILKKQYGLKIIALFFLSIISLRSMMLCSGVFLFEVLNQFYIHRKIKIFNRKLILSYLIGTLPAFVYVISHYIVKGWIYSHENSPWLTNNKFISFQGLFKNIMILIHKYLDFGKVFIFVFLIISFLLFGKRILKIEKNRQLLLIAITCNFTVIVASLLSTNTFGHRYFIVSYIAFILFSFLILNEFYKAKKSIYLFLFLGLITGNLWIYPREIAQGWDATLAHIPYHKLRLKAINYLDEENIKIDKVATFFPNINSLNNIDLSGDKRSFTKFNGTNKYVFYSTVYNLSDENLNILENNYTILKQFNNFNINITIYTLKEK